jgi:hypothetical protein
MACSDQFIERKEAGLNSRNAANPAVGRTPDQGCYIRWRRWNARGGCPSAALNIAVKALSLA